MNAAGVVCALGCPVFDAAYVYCVTTLYITRTGDNEINGAVAARAGAVDTNKHKGKIHARVPQCHGGEKGQCLFRRQGNKPHNHVRRRRQKDPGRHAARGIRVWHRPAGGNGDPLRGSVGFVARRG